MSYLFIFIAVLTLPAIAIGVPDDVGCFSDRNVMDAGQSYMKDFETNVENGWKINLAASFRHYLEVVSKTCNKSVDDQALEYPYIRLMKFALTNDLFPDFMNNNTVNCIIATKNATNTCIHENVAEDVPLNRTDVMKIWHYSKLNYIHHACDTAEHIKKCTLENMKKNTECTGNGADFVESLFNFFLDYCVVETQDETKQQEHETNDQEAEPRSGLTNKLLIILTVVTILSVLYVLIRDWWFNMMPCLGRGAHSGPTPYTSSHPLATINQQN